MTTSIERADALERVHNVLAPFENELLMSLMHDKFSVADKLKGDLESL